MTESAQKVVVVGGGMAGLTAAAYLAQAGIDVEVFEQHYRVGGCCTSFRRRKFIFDAAIHGVGGCQPGGFLHDTFVDLGIWERLELLRSDPMDVIFSDNFYVPIWTDHERFIEELRQNFPHEGDRLAELVRFLSRFGLGDLKRWGKATFRDVLDHYLRDDQAKAVFIPPLGNLGMSARRMDAVGACTLWRENQLNGGYAPRGSFQAMADLVAERIVELGGKVHPRHEVSRIDVEGGAVVGVQVRPMLAAVGDERYIPTRHVIGAAAVPHLYDDLIGREHVPRETAEWIDRAEYSLAGIAVFLGLNVNIHEKLRHGGNHWYIAADTIDEVEAWVEPGWIEQHMFDDDGPFYFAQPTHYDPTLAPEGKSVMIVLLPGVCQSREYWKAGAQERMGEVALNRVSQLIPQLRDYVESIHVATSSTVEWYTRNTRGAWYGWALTPDQSNLNRPSRKSPIKGLVLAGHWTRPGAGLINAVKSGQLAGKALARELTRSPARAAAGR
jgi:phytoene dehydrogenase-like protein